MRALVIGGTGPTGPPVVNGLIGRGYEVTILHSGRHEVDTIPEQVEHVHTDAFDIGAVANSLGERSFDAVFAMYGRLRDVHLRRWHARLPRVHGGGALASPGHAHPHP